MFSLGSRRRLPFGFSATKTARPKRPNVRSRKPRLETLEQRRLLTATIAIDSGNWNDAAIWSSGVPTAATRAIIPAGQTVLLNSTNQVAREIVVNGGTLSAVEGVPGSADRRLAADWIHVNSGGVFQIGTAANRYDNNDFVVTLTGTNPTADFVVETAMGSINITDNNGFLMTGMNGRLQFFGDEKLTFTKLAATALPGATTITVANVIERNFNANSSTITTSAANDGALDWQVGDEIVIASSTYNYSDEEVRTITGITVQGANTVLTLNTPLAKRHYGEIETYSNSTRSWSIDMRAEAGLRNRSIRVEGTQDTDNRFGDRARYGTTTGRNLGVGGHVMIMPNSGQITIDSVQFEKMGQTGRVGRYPVHWHLGGNRTGDVIRQSSVTNSNNRGIVIHGTANVLIEGNLLHDIHGHGFFIEDGVETGNRFISNIAFGIHRVGGGTTSDPFIVPGVTRGADGRVNGDAARSGNGESSHDTGQQVATRFLHSSAYWITNPDNVFVGNVSAGSEGTGFWYALPNSPIGLSRDTGLYNGVNALTTRLRQFDYNTTHSSPVGLTFDRGSDIDPGSSNTYSPTPVMRTNFLTGYKHRGTAVYHRGLTAIFNESRFADNAFSSFNTFNQEERNILFVGHSRGNADFTVDVGGYRLYDGPGFINGAHFAGFARPNAYTFRTASGANKHAHTRAQDISYENDGTADHLSIDFTTDSSFNGSRLPTFISGRPDSVSGAVLDVDGSLTGHAGGGPNWVLVPKIDFNRDADDLRPAGWNAYLSNDRYGQFKLGTINRVGSVPDFRITNGAGFAFLANRRNLADIQRMYVKLNAGDYTIRFESPVPAAGLEMFLQTQRVNQPGDATMFRLVGVGTGFKPDRGANRTSVEAVRASTSTAFHRDFNGDLWIKIFQSSATISLLPTNDPLPPPPAPQQTAFVNRTATGGTRIEAEEFDNGGANVAFLDNTPGNAGNQFRTGVDVDLFNTTDQVAAIMVGSINSGEWLEYTAAVDPGIYDVSFRVSSGQDVANSIRLLVAEDRDATNFTLLGQTADIPFTGASGNWTTVTLPGVDLSTWSGSDRVFRLEFVGSSFNVNWFQFDALQSSFTPRVISGVTRIESEEFDNGGQGIAYSDTAVVNVGGQFRTHDGVDIYTTADGQSEPIEGEEPTPGYTVGAISNNEWIEYTADIVAGVYDVRFRVASPNTGREIRLLVADNVSSTNFTELGTVTVPNTGAFGNYTTVTLPGVDLSTWAGTGRVLRWEAVGTGFNFNWFEFEQVQSPFAARTITDGAVVQFEDFDHGGNGLAYFDPTPGNTGGATHRTDQDVDISVANDAGGGFFIGGVASGEWYEYTADVVDGIYDVDVRVAAFGGNRTAALSIATDRFATEFTTLGSVTFAATGGSQAWTTMTIANVDLRGWGGTDRVLRFDIDGAGGNYNWFEFNSAVVPASVIERGVAYRGATAVYGHAAVDPNKSGLLPGQTASTANYTNFTRGLNRVVVDVADLPTAGLTADDFIFRIGNSSDPSSWTLLSPTSTIPLPTITSVATSVAGVQRLTLDWPDNAIQNTWLQVTVRSTVATGLIADDVFYLGNQIGDVTGTTAVGARVRVDSFDTLAVRRGQSAGQNSVGITSSIDVDRNGRVDSFDTLAIRRNQAAAGGLLMMTAPIMLPPMMSFSSQSFIAPVSALTSAPVSALTSASSVSPIVIAPVDADLISVGGSYLDYDVDGSNWYNGSGLSDPTIVETGDPVPAVWPTHLAGQSPARISRIRDAAVVNTLTFDLGGTFDITGMALWNSTESGQTDRGFENTVLSYSTDGGTTFTGSDALIWTQLSDPTTPFGPEVRMLPATRLGVTHIRMNVDNFSPGGSDPIVMASELRFIGTAAAFSATANLSVRTLNDNFDLRQGVEGTNAINVDVTLSRVNITGSPITFDLTDIGGGTAVSGLDYAAIAPGTKISIPNGATSGTLRINVVDDFLIEATESLRLQISNPSLSTVTLGNTTASASINDNDTAGVTLVGADSLAISEAGTTDTYTIALNTIPTGPVQITAAADPQMLLSIDGVNFAATQVLTFTDRTPQSITVRAVVDRVLEGPHAGTIRHNVTGPIVDPNYPDVTVESLYTQTGTDPTFRELIDNGILPDNVTSTTGVTGSVINVNNAVLEQGPFGNRPFETGTRIHTLGNSSVFPNDFDKWSRWYQQDGQTQIYRIFQGEENTRNDRDFAARIESWKPNYNTGVWNDFSARYTVIKPQFTSLFQSFQNGVEWSAHIGMEDDGSVTFSHRRGSTGNIETIVLATDMIGKSFDVLVRDNGFDYQIYFNGELKGFGTYERPGNSIAFRWGIYRGSRPMTQDALVFISGARGIADTSDPVGLVPYRPATTSLSIASATATIEDVTLIQEAFVQQTIQPGTRILAEEFDLGGPGLAYFDTTPGNRGLEARPDDDVDLFAGSVVLSDIANGEWLEHTRDIVPGIYDIDVQAWSNNDNVKGVRLLVGDNNSATTFTEVASVQIPNTNNQRISHTIRGVDLTAVAGTNRVLRVEFFGSNFSYDWTEFNAVPAASVAQRGVAYRGATAAYGSDTVDPSKFGLRPGQPASAANYTNFTRGLNRVVVDIANLPAAVLTVDDFVFRVGNSDDPTSWTLLTPTSAIPLPTITTSSTVTGVHRVTLDWPDNAIENTWLQVTVRATGATGLAGDDVFYLGNQIGDVSGTTAVGGRVRVDSFDTLATRRGQNATQNSAGIDNVLDVDRNGRVDSFDSLAIRRRQVAGGGLLMMTAPPNQSSLIQSAAIFDAALMGIFSAELSRKDLSSNFADSTI